MKPAPNPLTKSARRPVLGQHLELVAGRLAGAALLAWMGWIHLHLWHDGYRHLHIVGVLFLLNFIGAVALGLALLATPERFLVVPAGAGFGMFTGTLVALIVSVHRGLFGFKDSFSAQFAHLSVWVEAIGIAVCLLTTARAGLVAYRGRRLGRASAGAAGPASATAAATT